MPIIDHDTQPFEAWRPGVMTQMRISALVGSAQLTIFDQVCDPGQGAPSHQHAVEEVLSVLSGEAEIWIDDETYVVRTGQSAVIPAGHLHGFRALGLGPLHVRAVLAAPIFEASYADRSETSRRWSPAS